MIVDGKALSLLIKDELKTEVSKIGRPISLAVILVGRNVSSLKYIAKKKQFGEEIGVTVKIFKLNESIKENDLAMKIKALNNNHQIDGIIIQLPLPAKINTKKIISLISVQKDVDALGKNPLVMSPVAAVVQTILKKHNIDIKGKKAVVIGKGKLVGQPVAAWLSQTGAKVEIIDSQTADNLVNLTKTADILILGAGQPGLIKPEMIKTGVILIDAGTSALPVLGRSRKADGQLVGDASPNCADKCSLFTPVPGGVGPLTVAMLFKNLLELARR